MLRADGFARFLNVLFLASGIAGIGLAHGYLKRLGIERGEYYSLLLFTLSGMMTMAYAVDLIMVFLALELLSIPLYVLTGFARPQLASEEASLKYFLLGTFASGFVLFGIAMIFGATAHTGLVDILASIQDGSANTPLLLVGAALLLVGFGFKVAAVPFHMWTPDVYHGAPSPVTGFMSVGAKAAGFAALMRVFSLVLPGAIRSLRPDPVDPGCPDHVHRQPAGHPPDQYQATAGLLQHRACRLHPDGLRALRGRSHLGRGHQLGHVLSGNLRDHLLRDLGYRDHAGKNRGGRAGTRGFFRAGQKIPVGRGLHAGLPPVVHRHSAPAGILGQADTLQDCAGRWLSQPGDRRHSDLAVVGILLPQSCVLHVHARWRAAAPPG